MKAVRNTTGPWAYWIRIDAVEDEGKTAAGGPPTARVEGEIEGQTVRVYIPYGQEWYGYLMRRLAERPSNLGLFVKSLISQK